MAEQPAKQYTAQQAVGDTWQDVGRFSRPGHEDANWEMVRE